MNELPLRTLSIKNFKAIRDSGKLVLTPLTVLIGHNGSGKSSLVDALQTIHTLVDSNDLDAAMQAWRGLEYIRNSARARKRVVGRGKPRGGSTHPIEWQFTGHTGRKHFGATLRINDRDNCNEIFIEREHLLMGGATTKRLEDGRTVDGPLGDTFVPAQLAPGESLLAAYLGSFIRRWQFLNLNPDAMGNAVPQRRTGGRVRLARDGSNIAEYLLEFRKRDLARFDGLVETLRYVLPYAGDVQPTATSELGRSVYLQMTEAGFKVPGWLLSTGTLRVLALLAVLRHPEPAPLLLVEEIENGLDPRTIHLLVDEIQSAVETAGIQVIATTHSPYLLDLVPISSIVLVDRVDGEPRFLRPSDEKGVRKWSETFAPGQLYTMGRLRRNSDEKSG